MRKYRLFLRIFLFVLNISYFINAIAADVDETKIIKKNITDKKIIFTIMEDVVENFNSNNLEGIMKHISASYSEGCNNCNYDYFRNRYSGIFSNISRTVVGGSCKISKINKFSLKADKAGFDLVFSCSGHSKAESKPIKASFFKIVRMEKEKGVWKIVSFKYDEEGNLVLCKNAIKQFIEAIISNKIELAARHISVDYSGTEKGKVINYGKFMEMIKNGAFDELMTIKKYQCADFDVESYRFIHDKDVLVNIILRCGKGGSADSGILSIKREISLVKERKKWMVNNWKILPAP
jgi:hypothetical protein